MWLLIEEGVSIKVNMKEYQRAELLPAEVYREQGVVEWGVYKWLMRRARGHEPRARWDRLTR